MKKTFLNKVLKGIIRETVAAMQEAHEHGEWWIDSTGQATFCDRDVADQGHDNIVISGLSSEILEHFGIGNVDDPGTLDQYEESIHEALVRDGEWTEEDERDWNNMAGARRLGPAAVILDKLITDKAYPTTEQAKDAVTFAYGGSYGRDRDPRDYAMRYWNWKRMESKGGDIYIQTWHLKPEDLKTIVRGIWEIMDPDFGENDPDDSDAKVGEDGYPGPRVDVEVRSNDKMFRDIPLAVLEKYVPTSLMNYRQGHQDPNMKEGINEDYHFHHNDYRMYEGHNRIIALFENGSRLTFEVHYHDKHGEDREKWRHKAFTKWKSLANEIHRDVQLTEVGNPIQKTWHQSFKEALSRPELQEYIRQDHHKRVTFEKKKSKVAPIMDPVNFTRTG